MIPSSRLLRCYAVTDPRGGQAGAVSFPLAAPAHTSIDSQTSRRYMFGQRAAVAGNLRKHRHFSPPWRRLHLTLIPAHSRHPIILPRSPPPPDFQGRPIGASAKQPLRPCRRLFMPGAWRTARRFRAYAEASHEFGRVPWQGPPQDGARVNVTNPGGRRPHPAPRGRIGVESGPWTSPGIAYADRGSRVTSHPMRSTVARVRVS